MRSASSPKVCAIRGQRGSVARSIWGWSATRRPTATYSARAMAANSRTSSSDPIAARPSGSGHCENGPARIASIGLSVKWWRGSVESVTGIWSGCSAASACSALCHWANSRPSVAAPSRLKWVRRRCTSISSGDGFGIIGLGASRGPGRHHRVEHQPGLVLERHPGQQVSDAPVDGDLGVLVWVSVAPFRRHLASSFVIVSSGSMCPRIQLTWDRIVHSASGVVVRWG